MGPPPGAGAGAAAVAMVLGAGAGVEAPVISLMVVFAVSGEHSMLDRMPLPDSRPPVGYVYLCEGRRGRDRR